MKDNAVREDGLSRRTPRLPDPGKTLLVEDIPPIEVRMTQLGLLAVEAVGILPRNFYTAASSDDLIFEAITADLVMLGKQLGLNVSTLGVQDRKSIHEHDAATIGAVIIVCLETLNNVAAYIEFFNLVANYLKRHGKGHVNDQTEVIQEVVVTKHSLTKRIVYRGPLSGLSSVVRAGQEALSGTTESDEANI